MNEYGVKVMVADLMEALDEAGEGHSECEAYVNARRWMDTGDARPIHNVCVKVSRHHYYRIQAKDFDDAAEQAEYLACSEHGYDPSEWLIDSDEDESTFDFDSLEIHSA